METKKNFVAISYDKDKKCDLILSVKNITDKEYAKLFNEQEKHKGLVEKETHDAKVKREQLDELIQKDLKHLKTHDLLIAKAIYDNFVDRGLLENDDKFQQDYFDYIFNSCELDVLNAPYDFKVILRKVVSL